VATQYCISRSWPIRQRLRKSIRTGRVNNRPPPAGEQNQREATEIEQTGTAVQIPDIDDDYKSVEAKKAGFRRLFAAPLSQSGRAIVGAVAGLMPEQDRARADPDDHDGLPFLGSGRLFHIAIQALEVARGGEQSQLAPRLSSP
jgi:hypothetical protein